MNECYDEKDADSLSSRELDDKTEFLLGSGQFSRSGFTFSIWR